MKFVYKVIQIILVVFIFNDTTAQREIISEEVPLDFKEYSADWGPNQKKYRYTEFSFDTYLPWKLEMVNGPSIKPSFNVNLSFIKKRKINNILSTTRGLGVEYQNIFINNIDNISKHNATPIVVTNNDVLNPQVKFLSLNGQLGLRFNFDPKRGNQLGKFLELNPIFHFNAIRRLRYRVVTNSTTREKLVIREHNNSTLRPLNLALRIKIGNKNTSVFSTFFVNNLMDEVYPFPSLSVGFSKIIN